MKTKNGITVGDRVDTPDGPGTVRAIRQSNRVRGLFFADVRLDRRHIGSWIHSFALTNIRSQQS
jgi:hypothetical protein